MSFKWGVLNVLMITEMIPLETWFPVKKIDTPTRWVHITERKWIWY